VTVVQHLADAHREARNLAAALGLSRGQTDAVCRAAALHDVGKVHDAFQQMLLREARPRGAWSGRLSGLLD
jgi:response regulator RpfG family c-di-GMP phosphodiesterase